ncbi:MAG: FtsQ-type POTRA domain-containing protein [Gemmatimonadota bacterium]|nr:FtsQ-type POTRA domain-containing protein [Gemmatimonadota bacterium]
MSDARTALIDALRWLWWKPLAVFLVLAVVATSPWWGPPALAPLSYFRVRRVEIEGARFLAPQDVLARLRIDTTRSVWDDVRPLERRVAAHPQVRSVRVERKLPGTLVVYVTENLPIALTPAKDALTPVDASGRLLPIDPSRVGVDLPVVPRVDTMVLRVLADIRAGAPALFDRISDARRSGHDDVLLRFATLRVLVRPDVGVARLSDIVPVEQDLVKKNHHVTELDLRFRDQVVARVQ